MLIAIFSAFTVAASTSVGMPNDPPTAPTITGQEKGKANTSYEYTFNATDPDNDDVKYLINWGDNTTNETDFHASGTEVIVKHTYSEDGTYNITAIAEDINGAQGPEGTLTVEIPRNRAVYHPLLLQLFKRFTKLFPILRYFLGFQ